MKKKGSSMKNLVVFVGCLVIGGVANDLFGADRGQLLDNQSALSRDIEGVLRRVKSSGAQDLSVFELGEYANLFLTEKAHELTYRAYREMGQEPILLPIVDPAYKTAHMLLHQSFTSQLMPMSTDEKNPTLPKNQSAQSMIQLLDTVANNSDSVLSAVKAALSISTLKAGKEDYIAKLEDAQAQVKSLQTKISDLQKAAEPVKKTETPAVKPLAIKAPAPNKNSSN
jgi:hypothetical protein